MWFLTSKFFKIHDICKIMNKVINMRIVDWCIYMTKIINMRIIHVMTKIINMCIIHVMYNVPSAHLMHLTTHENRPFKVEEFSQTNLKQSFIISYHRVAPDQPIQFNNENYSFQKPFYLSFCQFLVEASQLDRARILATISNQLSFHLLSDFNLSSARVFVMKLINEYSKK